MQFCDSACLHPTGISAVLKYHLQRPSLSMDEEKALHLLRRNLFGSRDLCHSFRYSFRLVFECQISLRDYANALTISIDHRNTPDLMLLHCLLAAVQILPVATGHW